MKMTAGSSHILCLPAASLRLRPSPVVPNASVRISSSEERKDFFSDFFRVDIPKSRLRRSLFPTFRLQLRGSNAEKDVFGPRHKLNKHTKIFELSLSGDLSFSVVGESNCGIKFEFSTEVLARCGQFRV